MSRADAIQTLSIVVPVYNEEEVVETFHQQLQRVIDQLPVRVMVYYINDGSTDRTGEIVPRLAAADRRVAYLELSRNFGHQAALTAGWFYRFINQIGETKILPGAADYRLMSRQVVEALKRMPEYHRFLRGMIP